MGGAIALLYGTICYAVFLATFLYAVVFVGNIAQVPGLPGLLIPKTIDSGTPGPLLESAVVNVILLSIFALQHSVMARPAFKRIWTRVVPASVERSTYVLLASLALALIFWQWRPIPGALWTVTNGLGALVLTLLFLAGWGTVLVSTFLVNHFELFGLRQVWLRFGGHELPVSAFRTPLLYKLVRHPIYLGFIVAFWSTPMMSLGHLLFALVTTGYIFVGIFLEERDLVAHFGQAYITYRVNVRMLLPLPRHRGK
jgi:protein-S-isoprenylcysteine O-methyltransferase Ste14